MKTPSNMPHKQTGFSMIEVLVALVILMVGLLGLAGLMVQSQRSEVESYQRVQALILLQDMANRINANRKAASCYPFTNNVATGAPYLGATSTLATPTVTAAAAPCTAAAIQAIYPTMPTAVATASINTTVYDMNEWHKALLGTSETLSAVKVGAMADARGCVSYDATQELQDPVTLANIPGSGIYTISVAWQGLGDTFANGTYFCGKGQYPAETQRRVIGMTIRIANLK